MAFSASETRGQAYRGVRTQTLSTRGPQRPQDPATPSPCARSTTMARNPSTTMFDVRDPAHRTVREWRHPGIATWHLMATVYARTHGEAKVLRADGSVIVYRRAPDGTVRQRTYQQVVFVREASPSTHHQGAPPPREE